MADQGQRLAAGTSSVGSAAGYLGKSACDRHRSGCHTTCSHCTYGRPRSTSRTAVTRESHSRPKVGTGTSSVGCAAGDLDWSTCVQECSSKRRATKTSEKQAGTSANIARRESSTMQGNASRDDLESHPQSGEQDELHQAAQGATAARAWRSRGVAACIF